MSDRASSVPPEERGSEPDSGGASGTRRKELVDQKVRASGEITQPFLLEKKGVNDSSSAIQRPAVAASATEQPAQQPTEQPAQQPTERPSVMARSDVRRIARRLSVIVLFNATLYAGVAAAGALRYYRDRNAIPEVVLAIVAAGVAIWGALAGHHLWVAARGGAQAGHELAGAFSNLRSIFVLKGTALFLVLALSCFAFSAVLSLAALL